MVQWILIAVALALGLALVLRARKRPDAKTQQARLAPRKAGSRGPGPAPAAAGSAAAARAKAPSEAIDKFRGAALFPQKGACEAIMKLRGKTFPEGRVPHIPVPGCDRDKCDCQIHDVVGRRRGPRRISTDRRGDVRFVEDRRTGKDRREGVETWKQSVD